MLASEQIKSQQQIPLIHFFHQDDQILLHSSGNLWFKILQDFPWEEYRNFAVKYYDALYYFNLRKFKKSPEGSTSDLNQNNESLDEARNRLLFDRTTMKNTEGKKGPILFKGVVVDPPYQTVKPEDIFPGAVPLRLGGKKPKCFFAMLKSFIGTTLMGFPPEPEKVNQLLTTNPSFARVCGFIPVGEKKEYFYRHIPSLRKLEQFDQIMKESGLLDQIKWKEIHQNLNDGVIKKETELVGDTTHYHARSGFETVHYEDEKGKKQKKSQSKMTKNCRCAERENCPHPWELADDGAGTVVKSKTKMYWGHKASILGFPRQGIPLDAVAISDAATFDGETFLPHVQSFFEKCPDVFPHIKRVLYDSACDNQDLKNAFQDLYSIELKASFNPRRAKEVTENLPRGIEKITAYGNPICKAGFEMDYKGIRWDQEKFIYQAPKNEKEIPQCFSCPFRKECCPNSLTGRMLNISFETLPQIDPLDPPMAKRFKAIMSRRPAVERMIKRLKCDLSDDRLSKRGNASFQAYLDKTMIAFHILLRN